MDPIQVGLSTIIFFIIYIIIWTKIKKATKLHHNDKINSVPSAPVRATKTGNPLVFINKWSFMYIGLWLGAVFSYFVLLLIIKLFGALLSFCSGSKKTNVCIKYITNAFLYGDSDLTGYLLIISIIIFISNIVLGWFLSVKTLGVCNLILVLTILGIILGISIATYDYK